MLVAPGDSTPKINDVSIMLHGEEGGSEDEWGGKGRERKTNEPI